jgi:hypothetical protein
VPGHARTPGRHHRLGGPLPRQQPNTTTARPTAPKLWIAPDARSEHRWELPAVSRGYAQPWGWLPSPYSPLRHWPSPKTRPVRLACLIHAANVHSEPGSNPSQMSRAPPETAPAGAVLAVSDPHPKGLRKILVAQRFLRSESILALTRQDAPKSALTQPCRRIRPARNMCRSLKAVPPPSFWRPTRRGRSGATIRTPASLKGL